MNVKKGFWIFPSREMNQVYSLPVSQLFFFQTWRNFLFQQRRRRRSLQSSFIVRSNDPGYFYQTIRPRFFLFSNHAKFWIQYRKYQILFWFFSVFQENSLQTWLTWIGNISVELVIISGPYCTVAGCNAAQRLWALMSKLWKWKLEESVSEQRLCERISSENFSWLFYEVSEVVRESDGINARSYVKIFYGAKWFRDFIAKSGSFVGTYSQTDNRSDARNSTPARAHFAFVRR